MRTENFTEFSCPSCYQQVLLTMNQAEMKRIWFCCWCGKPYRVTPRQKTFVPNLNPKRF